MKPEVKAIRNSLQPNERAVLNALAEAWNLYLELSKAHPDQDAEFRHGIHALQHQIMARLVRRMLNAEPEVCVTCSGKKTVPSNLVDGYYMDCPACCGEEG